MAVRKNFRDENPDDRALADGVRRNERKNARRHDAEMLGEKRPRRQSQRDDVTERADEQQRAAAQPVNQPQADKREQQVGYADPDRLEQRGFFTEAGQLENARRKIENRVDAGKLVEKRDEKSQ